MKLWLLDADVVIKFLEIDVLDKLAGLHEVACFLLSEAYFRSNVDEGKKDFIYSIGKK